MNLKLHFIVHMTAKSLQSCLTLCDPIDSSLPGSSVHGIFRQEYWSGLPLPSPNILASLAVKGTFPPISAASYRPQLIIILVMESCLILPYNCTF